MLVHTTTIVTWLSLLLRLLIAIVSMNFLGKTWKKIRGKSKENLKEPPPERLNLCDRCRRAITHDTADAVVLAGTQKRSSSSDNNGDDGYIGDNEYYKSNEFNNSDESSTLDCDDDRDDDADIDELSTITTSTIKRKHTQSDYNNCYKEVKPVIGAAVDGTETDHYQQQQSHEKNQQHDNVVFRKNTVSMLTKRFEANEHNSQRTYSPISSAAVASATMIEAISSKYFSKKTDKNDLPIINGTSDSNEANNNNKNNKSVVADACWLEGPTSDNDDSLTDTQLMDTKKWPRDSADRLRVTQQLSTMTEDTSIDYYCTSDIDNNNYCCDDSDNDNDDTVEYRKKSTTENSSYVNSVDEILEQNRFSKRLSDYSLSDFKMDFSEHDDMEVTNIFNRI